VNDDGSLPVRPARPFVLHWLVDAAVVFCVFALPALFMGLGAVLIAAAVGLGLGLFVARVTHRAEVRALAARAEERSDQ
jgi:hypothetical protein